MRNENSLQELSELGSMNIISNHCTCSFSSAFGMRTMVPAITAPTSADASPNHQIALIPFNPISPVGIASTFIPIESLKDVMMAVLRLCTVISKLPAEPWYDLGTFEVMKMAAAAKLISGPNVARATPGIDSAQYPELGVCGRKNTGPKAKHTMLDVKIHRPDTTCNVLETTQAASTPTMPLGRRYRATVIGVALWYRCQN